MRFWRWTAAAVTATAVACGTAATGAVAVSAAGGPASVPVPQPHGSVDGQLAGVSCPSDNWCVAVGSYQVGHRVGARERGGVIETWNGARWSIAPGEPALKPIAQRPLFLYAVSCASRRACIAVGERDDYTTNPSGQPTRVSLRWNGRHWSPVPLAVARNAQIDLDTVSCAGPSDCTAVGTISRGQTGRALVEHYNGHRWSIAYRAPARVGRSSLLDVSCPARGRCVAVGRQRESGHGRRSPLVLAQHGGNWRTLALKAGPSSVVSGVSCASAGDCLIVGANFNRTYSAIAERYDGRRLHAVALPSASSGGPDILGGVTCASTTRCLLTGRAGASAQGNGRAVADLWDGKAVTRAFSGTYGAASCRPTFCTFVGTHAHRLTAHRWRLPATP